MVSFKLNILLTIYSKYIKSRNTRVVDPNFRYLFFTYYGKKCRQMSPTTIMSIINDSFNNLPNISEERKKQLNISTIQKSVITLMLTNGFSVEQILLFTELSVDTIYNYIDTKTLKNIATKTKKDLLSSKHPYAKLLF